MPCFRNTQKWTDISESGNIVHSPNFETGLVKLQDDQWEDLSPEEDLLMRPFLMDNSESDVQLISPTKDTTLAAAALKTKTLKRKIVTCPYVDVSHIPPTSNLVERLFSSAR